MDTQKALIFYDSVNYQIGLKVAQQQKCIDKLSEAILIVKENDDALIDTKYLKVLFKNFNINKFCQEEKYRKPN